MVHGQPGQKVSETLSQKISQGDRGGEGGSGEKGGEMTQTYE
jgi:hypothetical protein